MATGLENLQIYIRAVDLEIRVHLLTGTFPADEKYRSVDQLRRSSASVSNNIAESYYRRSPKEKIRILNDISKSEAEETRRNLEVSKIKKFHTDSAIIDEYVELIRMISGYVTFLKRSFLT